MEEESPEVRRHVVLSVPSPARDDFRGRGEVRETRGPISASLGAMRPLVGKLDMLLFGDAPLECSSKRVKDGMHLLKDDVEKISSYLDDLSELQDPPLTAKCWMNEVRDLSYDMEDYIDSLVVVRPKDFPLLPTSRAPNPTTNCPAISRLPRVRLLLRKRYQNLGCMSKR